jgi:hypothetical protein
VFFIVNIEKSDETISAINGSSQVEHKQRQDSSQSRQTTATFARSVDSHHAPEEELSEH